LVLFLVGCVGAASAPGTGGKGGTATMVLFQSDIDMQKKDEEEEIVVLMWC